MKRFLLFLVLGCTQLLYAQTADEIKKITADYDTQKLQSLSEQFHLQFKKDKEYVLKKAAELNIPLTIEEDGRYAELQKILPDGTPIYYTTFNADAARSTRTNHLQNGGSLGLNLMGQNMTAHIWDAKLARITHQEYDGPGGTNRYSNGDGSSGTHYHSAHVAGTIMASGLQAQSKGMAPYAKAVGYDWNNDLSEATNAANNKGMLISSHSYGLDASLFPAGYNYMFGAYTQGSRDWDVVMFNAPFYLMVNAAGNDGTANYNTQPLDGVAGYDKLTDHSTSKNSLVVANAQDANVDSAGNLISVYINSSSSQGPTDDYRIKPDITGNGTYVYSTYDTSDTSYNSITGTSMATPNVSGTLLLLQQHYNNLNSNYMKAATLKGLVLHTADDAGPSGPDAVWGWGLMNAKRAAETISYKDTHSIIQELSISNGQTLTINVDSDGINPLMASISWTDRPGAVNNTLNSPIPALVNDLDIRVTKGGTAYYPWRLTGVTTNGKGVNNVDPFERVDIANASGTYTITITHKGTLTGGNQNFSLIVTGIITTNCERSISSVSFDPVCVSGTSDIEVNGNSGTTQLRLYTVSLGGSPIATINGDSGSFTTPNITQSTTYYVAAADATCESARYPVTIIVSEPPPPINVVKVDHSTPGNCDLDYSELTASGGKLSNLTIGENDINSSGWAFVRNTTNLLAAYSDSDEAGGAPYEIVIYRTNYSNQQNSEIYIFPTVDGEDLSYDISGFTTINFQFKHQFNSIGSGSRNIYLGISTDGANYDLVWNRTNITGEIEAQTVNVDLSDFAGATKLFFIFRYYGDSAGVDSWYIDDIKITGDKQAPITWTPITDLYTDESLTVPYTGEAAMKVYAAPDNTTNYTANAAWVIGGCPFSQTVEVQPDLSDYLTSTGNWSVASNWSNNVVPDITKCVRVPNGRTLTVNVNNAEAKRLKVDAGGKIIIPKDRALTVDGSIINEGVADDFVVESGGSLVQNDDYAANSGPMTAKREFIFSAERNQYNYIISPVMGQKIKQIYNNPPFVIYHKEEYNFFYNAYDGDYIAGRGLAIKEPTVASVPASTIDAVMKGEPFNGILNYPLAYTTTQPNVDHGYNVVGNPYPSNLDIKQLYDDNSGKMEEEFLFWDNRGNTIMEQQGSDYEGFNYAKFNAATSPNGTGIAAPTNQYHPDKKIPTRFVRPGTAFMIRAKSTANGQTLNFKNEYRVAANDPLSPEFFGKGDEHATSDRYWLIMTTPSSMDVMTAVAYFEGGDDNYTIDDSDANGLSDELYTFADSEQVVIQGRKSFENTDEVLLGYRAYKTGTYIISVYDKEGVFAEGQDIYLIDNELNMVVNLSKKPYKFRTRAGEFNHRFVIVYRPKLSTDSVIARNQINFTKKDNWIVVESSIDKIDEIEIFDLNARSIYKKTSVGSNKHNINTIGFDHQIIVVKVRTETGETADKKFINN